MGQKGAEAASREDVRAADNLPASLSPGPKLTELQTHPDGCTEAHGAQSCWCASLSEFPQQVSTRRLP